jgi:AraC family transcriptional activator of pobA
MDDELNNIPELSIKDYFNSSSDLLIIKLKDLISNFSHIIKKPHRINFYQIFLIESGGGNIFVDTNRYICQPKSILAISKRRVAVFELSKNINGFALLFSEEYINNHSEDLAKIINLKLFDLSIPSLFNLSETGFNELIIFLKKILDELKAKDNFGKDEILVTMLKTFLLLAERFIRDDIKSNVINEAEGYLIEFKKKLERNINQSRSVHYYSDLLGITPQKLNQLTNSYWGKPAKKVIEERLLLEIKRLLIHTDKSLKEIGCSFGFNEPTNFNKFFKRCLKTTPALYRTRHKKLTLLS